MMDVREVGAPSEPVEREYKVVFERTVTQRVRYEVMAHSEEGAREKAWRTLSQSPASVWQNEEYNHIEMGVKPSDRPGRMRMRKRSER